MDGWMDGLMDGCMDGWMDGWMDAWMPPPLSLSLSSHDIVEAVVVQRLPRQVTPELRVGFELLLPSFHGVICVSLVRIHLWFLFIFIFIYIYYI